MAQHGDGSLLERLPTRIGWPTLHKTAFLRSRSMCCVVLVPSRRSDPNIYNGIIGRMVGPNSGLSSILRLDSRRIKIGQGLPLQIFQHRDLPRPALFLQEPQPASVSSCANSLGGTRTASFLTSGFDCWGTHPLRIGIEGLTIQ